MGNSASTSEGDRYNLVINPKKTLVNKNNYTELGGSNVFNGQQQLNVNITARAELIKKLQLPPLWEAFLDSSYDSFALTQSELTSFLKQAGTSNDHPGGSHISEQMIVDYVGLIGELSEKDAKIADVLAVCSSILLLNDAPIEAKIDNLFEWIVLGEEDHPDEFSFDQFTIAMSSFERGLSYAMGYKNLSDSFIKSLSSQWMALADPNHRGSVDSKTRITKTDFFNFCTNRQHVVRKLLENLASSTVQVNEKIELHEIASKISQNIKNESTSKEERSTLNMKIEAGDEWMSNPAWKKTAEKMLQIAMKDKRNAGDVKPSSTLNLEWVFGYRGFDCRNNVRFADEEGKQIIFFTAGVTVVQTTPSMSDSNLQMNDYLTSQKYRHQSFYGEHINDIIAISTHPVSHKNDTIGTLIATGEEGKTPSICLYFWSLHSNTFQSLSTANGYHKKGIAQLSFTPEGNRLISIGVEYSVAIYDTDCSFDGQSDIMQTGKNFGKMIFSGDGPKDTVYHVVSCGREDGSEFISCGSKHATKWTMDAKKGTLKQDTCQLGSFKNSSFLCVARVIMSSSGGGSNAIMGSSEGDLLMVDGIRVSLVKGDSHGGKSSVNALWTHHLDGQSSKSNFISGAKNGTVCLWTPQSKSSHFEESKSNSKAPSNESSIELQLLLKFSIFDAVSSSSMYSLSSKLSSKASSPDGKPSTPLPAIRSICLSQNGNELLIGTQDCEIIQFSITGNNSFVQLPNNIPENPKQFIRSNLLNLGHYKDELWGLSVRPNKSSPHSGSAGHHSFQFCTVGDDGVLRIWDVTAHALLFSYDMGGIARTCAYSPDGLYIAVGFGGCLGKKKKNKEDGMVRVYRVEYLNNSSDSIPVSITQVAEMKEAKAWISVIKFSPDGTTLAVGSRDNNIYLYSVMQQFKKRAKFSKHNAGINQFDFTEDGKYIQSCCSAYEILFSDPSNGAQISNGASLLADANWHTWTCTLGWPVIGIWSGSMDGSDVNAVDISPSKRVIATADDFGKVNLFSNPATKDGGSPHLTYSGHSSHVTSVRWLSTDTNGSTDDYLISIGGADKSTFIWKNSSSDSSGKEKNSSKSSMSGAQPTPMNMTASKDFDAPSGGDEFMAVKPWLGAIVQPTAWNKPDPSKIHSFNAALSELSNMHKRFEEVESSAYAFVTSGGSSGQDKFYEQHNQESKTLFEQVGNAANLVMTKLSDSGVVNSTAPDLDELELQWVHGYRGFDSGNNVFYIEDNSKDLRYILYYTAALGIVFNPSKRSQSYFKGHNDDITSMAVYKSKSKDDSQIAIVATGQMGMGSTIVWELPSMQSLSVLKTNQKSVIMLCFSQGDNGRLLISIGEDCTIAVSDWKANSILVKMDGEKAVTHQIVAAETKHLSFFTCGNKVLKYFTLNGRNLNSAKVITSKNKEASLQQFNCVALHKEHYFVGCEDGKVFVIADCTDGIKSMFSHLSVSPMGSSSPVDAPKPASNNKSKPTKAVNKASSKVSVTAIYGSIMKDILITGASDGSIAIWNTKCLSSSTKVSNSLLSKADLICAFNITTLAIDCIANLSKRIQSISILESKGSDILLVIGTRNCDIFEVICKPDNSSAVEVGSGIGAHGTVQLHCDTRKRNAVNMMTPTIDGIIVRSHCQDELWGVATHPTLPEFCTVGDDKTLRIYHLHTFQCLKIIPLGKMSRACCYSPDGSMMALGFGGRVGRGIEAGSGLIRVYSSLSTATVSKLVEKSDAKQWISDIKFSPDGSVLAVGAHDCKIYIYDVKKTSSSGKGPVNVVLTLRNTFAKHNSVINHFDFSVDGHFMQSNCAAYELLFSDVVSNKQITSATEVKDVKWSTWTCTLGWPVQGIWEKGMDGSDINSVARSYSGHLLASSDDLGKVNLYRYPCLGGAKANPYLGHSSHVTKVVWTAADEYLLSCGGNDKALMQWKHIIRDMSQMSSSSMSESHVMESKRSSSSSKSEKHFDHKHDDEISNSSTEVTHHEMHLSEPSGGDESGAVKPWLGAIRAPESPPPISPLAPSDVLELSWVHGYTSSSAGANDTRVSNNLFYNLEGKVIFPAAALGVLLSTAPGKSSGKSGKGVNFSEEADYEPSDNDAITMNGELSSKGSFCGVTHNDKSHYEQEYFKGHDDDILCLTMSKDRKYIATGQTASKSSKGKGSVIIWDAIQCRILSRLDQCHQRGVCNMAFSPDGSMLLTVGLDDQHSHSLWKDSGGRWSKVSSIASNIKATGDTIYFTAWVHGSNPMVKNSEYHFVSGGKGGIDFWKLDGATITKKSGRLGKKVESGLILCAANLQGKDRWRLIAGTSKGSLLSYDEREASVGIDGAHKGAILSLAEGSQDCLYLVSGGKDGMIRVWNQLLQPISELNITGYACVDYTIASMDVITNQASDSEGQSSSSGSSNWKLLVGTYGGEILELQIGSDSSKKMKLVKHSKGENTGSGLVDLKNMDLSSASVGILMHSHHNGELWGLAVHPIDPDNIATVGDDGTLRIWSVSKKSMLTFVKLNWPARSVAWHPSGLLLAVGFHERTKGGWKAAGDGKKTSSHKKQAKGTGKAHDEEPSHPTATEGNKGAVHLFAVQVMKSNGSVFIRKVAEGCDSVAWIGELKFSPHTGNFLAVGSHDKKLYFYHIPKVDFNDVTHDSNWNKPWMECLQKTVYAPFDKHSSAVLHVDFSSDELYWQSNCQAAELLFGVVQTGKQETSASRLANLNNQFGDDPDLIHWSSQTCKLGWAVQGIWLNGSDTSDINAVDGTSDWKLIATADDFGLVKIFRYPCVKQGSQAGVYEGHSSHVTNVRWTKSNYLTSVGGNDKCLFVWKLTNK